MWGFGGRGNHGGFFSSGLMTNLLLLLVSAGLILNVLRVTFTGWGKKFDMSAGNLISNLDGVVRIYSKALKGSRSSDVGTLATKLDECWKHIKKDDLLKCKVDKNHLAIIRKAHRRLNNLLKKQRAFFNGGFRDCVWEQPKVTMYKAQGLNEEEATGKAMGYVAGRIIDEELKDLEDLVENDLLGILLDKIDEDPNAAVLNVPKRKLTMVRKRIFGMIAEVLPSVLRKALTHPGILPTIRECI